MLDIIYNLQHKKCNTYDGKLAEHIYDHLAIRKHNINSLIYQNIDQNFNLETVN